MENYNTAEDKKLSDQHDAIEALNLKIMELTMKIRNEHRELSKYLDEMPVSVPNIKEPEITFKNLSQYYDSLKALLDKYADEHKEHFK